MLLPKSVKTSLGVQRTTQVSWLLPCQALQQAQSQLPLALPHRMSSGMLHQHSWNGKGKISQPGCAGSLACAYLMMMKTNPVSAVVVCVLKQEMLYIHTLLMGFMSAKNKNLSIIDILKLVLIFYFSLIFKIQQVCMYSLSDIKLKHLHMQRPNM